MEVCCGDLSRVLTRLTSLWFRSNMSAAWSSLPSTVLEILFTYLDIEDLRNCSLVCKKWYRFLNDENNDVWRLHCVRKLAEEALKSDLLTNVPTYKAKLRSFYHAWNPNDCSRNVYIKQNGFTLHRNPVAQSTDGSRGKLGFRTGRHCWEVWWEGPLGTVAVIGIATKNAPMQCHGYVALLGSDDQSWGWNLVDNHLLHNGDSQGNFPQLNNAPKYQVSCVCIISAVARGGCLCMRVCVSCETELLLTMCSCRISTFSCICGCCPWLR